jgi:SAM-dependent methyltransferase
VDATYGPSLFWYSWTGRRADGRREDWLSTVGVPSGTIVEPPELLRLYRCRGGMLPSVCAILMRRSALELVGGFEEEFRGSHEDQVLYAKMGLQMRVLVTGRCLDLYRQHPASACAVARNALSYPGLPNPDEERYLVWLEGYLRQLGIEDGEIWASVQQPLERYRNPFSLGGLTARGRRLVARSRAKERVRDGLPSGWYAWAKRTFGGPGAVTGVRLGHLRRLDPVSVRTAAQRGRPIDQAWVDEFLDRHAADVRGRVMEVGTIVHVKARGAAVDHLDLVDVDPRTDPPTGPAPRPEGEPVPVPGRPSVAAEQPVADVAHPDAVPTGHYDCIVAVGGLHQVPDPAAVVSSLHDALAEGGVVLAAVPGMVQRQELHSGPVRWGMTSSTVRELFEDAFPDGEVEVEAHGNVLAATALLHGLAADELDPAELAHRDPRIEVLVTVRAVRSRPRPG